MFSDCQGEISIALAIYPILNGKILACLFSWNGYIKPFPYSFWTLDIEMAKNERMRNKYPQNSLLKAFDFALLYSMNRKRLTDRVGKDWLTVFTGSETNSFSLGLYYYLPLTGNVNHNILDHSEFFREMAVICNFQMFVQSGTAATFYFTELGITLGICKHMHFLSDIVLLWVFTRTITRTM